MLGPRLGLSTPPDDSWVARALADQQRQLTQLGASPIITVATPIMASADVTTWPSTTATALTTIALTYLTRQTPALRWRIQTYTQSGVTAQYALVVGSTQLATFTASTPLGTGLGGTSGGSQTLWVGSCALPASLAYGADFLLTLQARVTAGSGIARAQPLLLSGAQSA